MTLTFDEATHVYQISGVIVPSVTGIIGHILPGWKASDWYLQRGRAVPQAPDMAARAEDVAKAGAKLLV